MGSKRKMSIKEKEIMAKTCLGKVKHKSRLAAEYYLDHIHKRGKYNLEIYNCPFCKFFHIGHNKKLDPLRKNKKSETAPAEIESKKV